ncbi:MAG: radical SAM protein [Acidimicrobiia bacterium]
MNVLVVSCYELGHQPLAAATAAAHLRAGGHTVTVLDLAVQDWDPSLVDWADRIALSTPMHTAMRIARRAIAVVRSRRRDLPVAAFGLYASMLDDVADQILVGETDAALVAWAEGRRIDSPILLGRDAASTGAPLPARDLLPPLERYAHLALRGDERIVGYVEASHGCAHRCRHCPVPVVYDGRIRIVDADRVLADATQQIEAGARHITFGDPDFLNGVHHSRRIVRALHDRFPDITFDCTVKVEHILRHDDVWGELADAGCLFVVSAFESVDEPTLHRLDKGHTVPDMARAVAVLRSHGIEIRPTWMPFTPWATIEHVRALLEFVAEHDLVGNVDPVQYTIRLLVPERSLLLAHADPGPFGPYDPDRGAHPWRHPDPAMDALQVGLAALVEGLQTAGDDVVTIYQAVRRECGLPPVQIEAGAVEGRPRLTEPWFC